MSIFGSIKDAIFGHPAAQSAPPATAAPAAPAQATAQPAAPASAPAPAATPAEPKVIDADAALANIYASKGSPDLDYKHSIVDLMKLIGQDPSLANRKELATELGYTGATDGSAEMNIWLHERVMERIRTGK